MTEITYEYQVKYPKSYFGTVWMIEQGNYRVDDLFNYKQFATLGQAQNLYNTHYTSSRATEEFKKELELQVRAVVRSSWETYSGQDKDKEEIS